ncbi:hypothetical protein ACFLSG_04225, partial [Candidatus Bipolaricaulota bacterium]
PRRLSIGIECAKYGKLETFCFKLLSQATQHGATALSCLENPWCGFSGLGALSSFLVWQQRIRERIL